MERSVAFPYQNPFGLSARSSLSRLFLTNSLLLARFTLTPLPVFLTCYICCDAFTSNWQSKIYQRYGKQNVDSFQMMFGVNSFAILFTSLGLVTSGEVSRSEERSKERRLGGGLSSAITNNASSAPHFAPHHLSLLALPHILTLFTIRYAHCSFPRSWSSSLTTRRLSGTI